MFNAFQKDLEKSEIEEIIAYFDMDHDELVSFLGLNLIV